MFKLMYCVWGLLPGFLLALAISAVIRKAKNTLKKGYASFYTEQAIYSIIALIISIIIDQTIFYNWFIPIADMLTEDSDIALNILAWLIYPAVLGIMTGIQQLFSKKEETKIIKNNYR